MKNKISLLGCVFIAVFLFSGCFDIYQNISQGKNNTVDVYTQITVSKMLMQSAAKMPNETGSNIDSDKFDDKFFDEILNELPAVAVECKKINSSSDFGICYKMSLDYKKPEIKALQNDKNALFFPSIENGEIRIKADFSDGNMLENNNDAMFFLSMAKYRLTIDKKVCPALSKAEVLSKTGTMAVTLTDAGNVYLVEIPVAVMYDGETTIIIK